MNRTELFKAACCNLGESFTTNPSVDVSYSDAATGARQIKLLGLAGAYVQMLTENIPNFRGAAMPYGLGYVPGPWMHSIQVSKGCASVKNGYESLTGQINVEYLKPQDTPNVRANLYAGTMGKFEANADANFRLSDRFSGSVLGHYENRWGHHDRNGDGFEDEPMVRQTHLMNRWAYVSDAYIFQAAVSGLNERRQSGQLHNIPTTAAGGAMADPYRISLETSRYEAFAKNAVFLDHDHGTNVALILSGAYHDLDALFGHKTYDATERNLYASLIFETNFTQRHSLSAGLSLNYDGLRQRAAHIAPDVARRESETTPGAYAQYTYTLADRLILMGGLRVDRSNRYGTFVTPRAHIKYTPVKPLSLRASIGKGYRTPHALSEHNYLLASGRTLQLEPLRQEAAWNYGLSATLALPVGGHVLNLGAEYYYTDFLRQAVVDYDSDPARILIGNLRGRSYSHTVQLEASYPFFTLLTVSAAWRWNDVRSTYGGNRMRQPLTSRYKGLLTLSYKTALELWQADVTLQLNGPGRLPAAVGLGRTSYHAFPQLNAQVTRWFRHWSVYIGGENLTAYRQRTPILAADQPWSAAFEPTLAYAPATGAMFYAGVRFNLK
ncbi:MAG: TonB-dependent receptor [Bacteroidaceae bacterium]|nr:TonB-dependent receptor [Bacteroidaceae bacterium]